MGVQHHRAWVKAVLLLADLSSSTGCIECEPGTARGGLVGSFGRSALGNSGRYAERSLG